MPLKELRQSYHQTISTMDGSIIYPFSEFEKHPKDALNWVLILESRLDPSLLTTREQLLKTIPNPSEIRSMFIMDLIDYFLAFVYPSNKVIGFYLKALSLLYPKEDPLSLSYTNKPIGSGKEVDFEFYENSSPEAKELLALSYAYAYAKNYDIFMGVSCETTGPFFRHGYTFLVTNFSELNLKFIAFERSWNIQNKQKVGVDLFGHSLTSELTNVTVLYNNKHYLNSVADFDFFITSIKRQLQIFQNKEVNRSHLQKMEKMLDTRIQRYGTLLGTFDREKLFKDLQVVSRQNVKLKYELFERWLDDLNRKLKK